MSWLSKASGYDLAKSVYNDLTGKTAADEAANAQREANASNIRLWQMQAQYNTPANQVARLRAAGLNPNLIYGSGSASTGNMSSAPNVSPLPTHQGSYAKLLDVANVVLTLRNLQAQNRNLNAQTADINAQTRQRNAQADYDSAVLDFYRKHGYFPGQTMAPTNVVKELAKQPFVKHSVDAVGTALGSVVGRLSTNVNRDPDRAIKWAAQVADKKGLNGQARVDFINKFVEIYRRSH